MDRLLSAASYRSWLLTTPSKLRIVMLAM